MSEQPQPTEHEVNTRMHVYRILDQHLDRAFEELDHLHKRGINDTEVIQAMRHGGYASEADAYIEWGNLQDPDSDVCNATTDPVVPDPGNLPSDLDHARAMETLGNAVQQRLTDIEEKYREKLHFDPVFAAKCKIADNVLTDLERAGRRDRGSAYAGYMVTAVMEEAASIQPGYEHLVKAQLAEAKHYAVAALDDVRHGYNGTLEVAGVMMPVEHLKRIQELLEAVESRLVA